jgi:acyl carrier protein
MNASAPEPEQSLVLRQQLPLPRPYIAPQTATEEKLAEIWRTALSMDCVGVEDSYHDLGGDSFIAAILFAMIEAEFGITVPMATLVDAPTIATLAMHMDRLAPP